MPSRKPLVIVAGELQQIQAGDSLGVRSSVNGSTVDPTTSSATFVQIPEMTTTVTTVGGQLLVMFDCSFRVIGLDSLMYALFIDGVEITGSRRQAACVFTLSLGLLNIDNQQPSSAHALVSPSAGSHTVDVRWARIGGVARANDVQRKLTVVELF